MEPHAKTIIQDKVTESIAAFSNSLTRFGETQIENLLVHLSSLKQNIAKLYDSEPAVAYTIRQINLSLKLFFFENLENSLFDYFKNLIKGQCVQSTSQQFSDKVKSIRELGWAIFFHAIVMKSAYAVLEAKVSDVCVGNYQDEFISDLNNWLKCFMFPCIGEIFKDTVNDLPEIHSDLSKALARAMSKVRGRELFDIIADFPDSIVAIRELKDASTSSSSQSYIGKVFRSAVCKRLLHPGASTTQIIDIYVKMIRALRILDPSDLLLNFSAAPVRAYLLQRKDTVRCIVSSLAAGAESDLHGELRRGGSLEYGLDEDDDHLPPGDDWMPRKRDPELIEKGERGLDPLALLVSTYGSTDIFVGEYRALLADRLLRNLDYNTDHELKTLELLKIRFGDEPLNSCEVMLRDMEEAKRTNNSITADLRLQQQQQLHQQSASAQPVAAATVDCVIVSGNYWPALPSPPGDGSELTYHRATKLLIETFQETYTKQKKPRKLDMAAHLGHVELELDFADGARRLFHVSPVQATLIQHLGDRSPLSEAALAMACGIGEEEVRKKMNFWVSKGVVAVTTGTAVSAGVGIGVGGDEESVVYVVVEKQAERAAADSGEPQRAQEFDADDDDLESMSQSNASEKALLEAIAIYVKGLLTAHEKMTVERLHTMLKLMMGGVGGSGGGSAASGDLGGQRFDMSIVQLQRHLQGLVELGKLDLIDGEYRLAGSDR